MTGEAVIGLAAATFVFAILPGPGVMAVIAQSLGRGFGQGARFTAGLALGDMIYLFMAMCGMGFAASQLGAYFAILKWIGAGYLIWLGLSCFRSSPPPQDAPQKPLRRGGAFTAGLCVTLGNPKAIAFYCGFLPGFVDLAALTPTDMAQVAGVTFPIIFLVPVGYAWLAARGRRAASSTRLWKLANRAAGTVMIGAGAAVVAD